MKEGNDRRFKLFSEAEFTILHLSSFVEICYPFKVLHFCAKIEIKISFSCVHIAQGNRGKISVSVVLITSQCAGRDKCPCLCVHTDLRRSKKPPFL